MIRRSSFIMIALVIGIICVGCKNTGNSVEKKDRITTKDSSDLEVDMLSKAVIAKPLSPLLPSCAQSANYQKEIWPGKNSCSWALEKQILGDLPEYVKRNDKELSFQTDQGHWRTMSVASDSSHLLVNAYLPKPHLFVLKQYLKNNCPSYLIYDPKTDKARQYNGNFFMHPNQQYFAVIASDQCGQENWLGRFSKSSGTIEKQFSTEQRVENIKWGNRALAYSIKNGGNNDFQRIDLP